MERKKERQFTDPLEQMPFGRMENRQIIAEQEWANIQRARRANSLPDGEERERVLAQIRIDLQTFKSVKFGSGGSGSGERHTRQRIPE
jgi:hypothetical protein